MKILHLRTLAIALFCSVLFCSCGGDEVTTTNSSATFDELNTCDIGSGDNATRFTFTVNYDSESDSPVSKVLFDINWSSGDTDNAETSNFTDSGSSITYSWCYRFGSEEWVEISHRLETEDGTEMCWQQLHEQ